MRFETKAAAVALSYQLETKAATARHLAIVPGSAEGRTFKGYASTFDVDLGGDLITRGAYADTLAEWRASGRPVPLVDSHNYSSIRNVVGKMIDASEDETGLLATFQAIGGPDGDAMLARVHSGAVTGLSIGYRVPRGGQRDPDARLKALGVVRILDRIALHEVSLVMSPMNPQARVTSPDGKALELELAEHAELRKRFDAAIAPRLTELAAERAEKLARLKATAQELARSDWRPDDPARIAMSAKLRGLRLRQLQLAASQ